MEMEFSKPLSPQLFHWRSFVLTVTTAWLVLGAYFLLRRNPRLKFYLDKLNGPKSYPVIGLAHHFIRPSTEYIALGEKWIEQYGSLISGWIGPYIAYVFTCDPPIIEKILSTTNHINKSNEYDLMHDWLGTGLLTAAREKWAERRKMLTPAFHFKILEDFIPVFNEQASIFVKCLETEADSGKSFDMHPYITKCTLDIICETAMGKKINAQTSTANQNYIDAINGLSSILLAKLMKPWFRIPIILYLSLMGFWEKRYLKTIKGFSEQVIQARKLERKMQANCAKEESENPTNSFYCKKRKAFLDLLLDASENGAKLSDSDIREEVDTFMFRGHDTTGVQLGWIVFLLSLHTDCQKKLQKELDEVFSDDPERDVTLADISKMKYLECCVKETLRLYPSVPLVMRKVDYDIVLDNGKIIPEGCTALVGIYYVHRNKDYFPDPNRFDPERFTLENSVKRHPFAYVPFSAGPRNCIGQKFALLEEKILLAKLFRKYRVEANVEKLSKVRPVPDVVLRCANGIHVYLYKRN